MIVDIPVFQIPGTVTGTDVAADQPASGWAQALKRAEAIRGFHEDWDGMGAEAPNLAHLDRCIALLQAIQKEGRLPPPAFVNAAPDGAICVEWQWPELRLEAEMMDTGVEWMLFPSKGPSLFFETRW